jgi:hypothetical protein
MLEPQPIRPRAIRKLALLPAPMSRPFFSSTQNASAHHLTAPPPRRGFALRRGRLATARLGAARGPTSAASSRRTRCSLRATFFCAGVGAAGVLGIASTARRSDADTAMAWARREREVWRARSVARGHVTILRPSAESALSVHAYTRVSSSIIKMCWIGRMSPRSSIRCRY